MRSVEIATIGLLFCWAMIFPATGYLFRRRLYERSRPARWANIPAWLTLAWVPLFGIFAGLQISDPGYFDKMQGLVQFAAIGAAALAVALPFLAGLGYLYLVFECLRPSRDADEVDVFD